MIGYRVVKMMRGTGQKIPLMLLGLAHLLVLGGCGGGTSQVVRSNFVEFSPDEKQEIGTQSSREYRIQEGDYLRLAFSYQRELNQEKVIVLDDGAVNLVGIDRVELAGLSLTEADSVITQAYAKEYRDPDLSVIVEQSVGRRVYVLGEVRNPGLHPVPMGGVGVIGAVTIAGGFSPDAAKSGTVLVRVTDDGYLVQEVDLDGFSSVAYSSLALVDVQSYDIIYVPRSRTGDFGYFSRTILAGLVNITRIASDIKYLSGGTLGRVY